MARWWWPILALAGFGTVAGLVLGHDQPAPGLSTRGLVTIALAALVVVLLTIHRAAGPGSLARAVAEYAVVAVLAGLLVGVNQPPSNPATSAAKTEAKQAAPAKPNLEAGQDQLGLIRVAAAAARAVTKAIRAVTGAARWVVDLWHQADQQTDRRPSHSSSTTTPTGEAMPPSPAVASTSTRRLL